MTSGFLRHWRSRAIPVNILMIRYRAKTIYTRISPVYYGGFPTR